MTRKLSKIFKAVTNFKAGILDLIFPRYCLGCNREADLNSNLQNSWFCKTCLSKIVKVRSQVCPQCHHLSLQGTYCPRCKKDKALKGIICTTYYEEGALKELVHNLKYNGVTELVPLLGQMMIESLQDNLKYENYILTFTPLHFMRQATRGYNQAQLLAEYIGQSLGIEVQNILVKTRATKRQVELQGSSRRKNLSGVFRLKTNVDIAKKKIIIVDDITTTGSTLNECAKVLKSAGAKEVWGLVIARG